MTGENGNENENKNENENSEFGIQNSELILIACPFMGWQGTREFGVCQIGIPISQLFNLPIFQAPNSNFCISPYF